MPRWPNTIGAETPEPESPAQTVARLRKAHDSAAPQGKFDSRIQTAYEKASGAPWPLDWRRHEKLWSQVAETFFAALGGENPAAAWRERIEADPRRGDLYRAAYLGMLRSRRRDAIDFDLIDQYVQNAPDNTGRMTRLTDSLISLAKAEVDVDNPRRRKLFQQLLQEVRKLAASRWHLDAPVFRALKDLAEFVKIDPAKQEADALLRALVQGDSPRSFDWFCRIGHFSPEFRARWFSRKEVELKAEDIPLGLALHELGNEVTLPIWIAPKARADATPISPREKGPWLQVVQRIAERGGYVLAPLKDHIFWIGPPDRLDHAIHALRISLGKIPPDSKLGAALRETTSFEFIETPLKEALLFVEQLHGIEVQLLAEPSALITANLDDFPLHLALTRTLQEAGYEWDVIEQTLVVGKPEQVAAFRRMATRYRRKMLDASLANPSLASALREATSAEFVETPIREMAAYLQKLHGVPVVVDEAVGRDVTITHHARGIGLGWALSSMLQPRHLAWSVRDGKIVLHERAK